MYSFARTDAGWAVSGGVPGAGPWGRAWPTPEPHAARPAEEAPQAVYLAGGLLLKSTSHGVIDSQVEVSSMTLLFAYRNAGCEPAGAGCCPAGAGAASVPTRAGWAGLCQQRRQTESAAKRKSLYTPRDRACRKHHQTCVKEETGGWSRRLGVRAELPGMAAGFEELQDFCSFSQLHNVQAAPRRKNRRSRVIRMVRYRSRRPQTAKYRHDSHREHPARRREVHESGIRDPEKPGAST